MYLASLPFQCLLMFEFHPVEAVTSKQDSLLVISQFTLGEASLRCGHRSAIRNLQGGYHGVPLARLAIYKVCWGIGCEESDILAGYDAAVGDGVDVISVSIGGPAVKYSLDGLAIGAYHAVEKGVAVAAGAGNFGIWTMQVINAAPWIFTIAASTIDRSIDKANAFISILKAS
ncbi:hypothetical protein SELMODRAFT_409165 [Selaginella moellendorffii]|uniref:Peptidase S8/S53 domain-containing protein n=1 Tax=Selaginella moellendorffii TaxID=88036 RepID=D8RAK3_SELML|nr:hypothetical protein SELMODRAFT_409165 [Selaginella moellendorffii]